MDPKNDEQTEILRDIWRQMVALSQHVNAMNSNLAAGIEKTNATVRAFMLQTHENFARVHRNFEKVHTRLEHLELGATRVDELDARLTRVEAHVGLREP